MMTYTENFWKEEFDKVVGGGEDVAKRRESDNFEQF
jgi:hypothetical protein